LWGRILALDNLQVLRGYGWPGLRKMRLLRQDKGHYEEIKRFFESIKSGGGSPIPAEEIFEVTRVSFELMKSLNT